MREKKVVCFGGGNALPNTVLKALKEIDNISIVSITSMVDDGGSTGALRRELEVLPPGDIRRHILALSEAEEWKKELWKFRFANNIVFEDGHKGHNFANIFITGLEYIFKKKYEDPEKVYGKVLEIVHDFMKVKGLCLPATLDKTTLYAELENGEIIEGENKIDVPKDRDGRLRIRRVWVNPPSKAYSRAVEEIKSSDYIIIGPGDLYSSIIPCFLHQGITDAIKESNAKKILVVPAMTKLGETYKFRVEDYASEVEKYISSQLDYVIFNISTPSEERIKAYKKENPLFDEIVIPRSKDLSEKFKPADLLYDEGPIEYDPAKLKRVLMNIFFS